MTTKAYYTKEVVKGFIARIMNEAVKLGITFSQGCQIHPSRLDASAESMTKLMNWICYARVVDHKDSVPDAKAYAAKAVEYLIKNPTRKFKLNAEWRQFSWWALRVIDCMESLPLTSKDEWEQWVRDHGLTGQRAAPEYETDRDAPDGKGDLPEGTPKDGRDGEPDDDDGESDEEGEPRDGDGEDDEDGDPEDGDPEDGDPEDGDPEDGEPEGGGEDAGNGDEDGDGEEQDEDGPDEDEEVPPMPPMPPEGEDLPEGAEDENTLAGFVWRVLNHGMTKVRAGTDDGKVVSALLMGPAGVGKTYSVKRLAKKLGAEVFVITAGQKVSDYLGTKDAHGNYYPSPMISAIWYAQAHPEQMVVILFDELDMTPADVTGCLFSLFASRELETMITGKVDCPKNLVLFAAMNTFGDGANDDFAGRTPVDKAMLNRFKFPYVVGFEEAIARRLCKDDNFVDLLLDWNQACIEAGLTKAVGSYRDLESFTEALEAGFSLNYALGRIVMGQTRDALDTIWGEMKGNKTRKYWQILKKCIEAVPEVR